MARSRNIKPGFYKNEDLAECSVWARLLFPGLWMLADREGRLEDRPKRIKGELFPYDSVEVDPLLAELEQWGFIERYVADGKRVISVCNFLDHQFPHGKEADSEFPDKNGVYTVNERDPRSGHVLPKQGKSETSPRQAQDKPETSPVQAAPESGLLNPESGLLNPESLKHTHTGLPNTEATGDLIPGSVCVFLRENFGFIHTNPDHPDLLLALGGGATQSDFAFAGQEAANKGKGFAYSLKIVLSRIEERKNATKSTATSGGASNTGNRKLSAAERAQRNVEIADELERQRSVAQH